MSQQLEPKLSVAFFPNSDRWDENPYLSLLRNAVVDHNVNIVDVDNDYLSFRWLWKQRKRVQVLHFHWLHYHYKAGSYRSSRIQLIHFARNIIAARTLGYRIVWTMHNVLPHDEDYKDLNIMARKLMLLIANAVIVLCEVARQELQQRFGRTRNVYITPIGEYFKSEDTRISKEAARENLAIKDESLVFLYFGNIRPYKGLEDLVQSFASIPGENLLLLVVGRPNSEKFRDLIETAASNDSRQKLNLQYVSNLELDKYLSACDIVVLPFRKIMSSSSAIAAISHGRPLIIPMMGCLPEWIPSSCGIFYDHKDRNGLREALYRSMELDLNKMGRTGQATRPFAFMDQNRKNYHFGVHK